MAYRLIVKGSELDAQRALADHDITVYTMGKSSQPETVLVSLANEPKYDLLLAKWYCEETGDAPYPPGTLLHYAEG